MIIGLGRMAPLKSLGFEQSDPPPTCLFKQFTTPLLVWEKQRGGNHVQNNPSPHIRCAHLCVRSNPFIRLLPEYPQETAHWSGYGSCRQRYLGKAESNKVAHALDGGTVLRRDRADR